MKVFLLRPGTRQGHFLSLFLFSIVLEIFARAMNKRKKKDSRIEKKEVFAGDLLLYIENLRVPPLELLQLVIE